jgi:hypothetical protein
LKWKQDGNLNEKKSEKRNEEQAFLHGSSLLKPKGKPIGQQRRVQRQGSGVGAAGRNSAPAGAGYGAASVAA